MRETIIIITILIIIFVSSYFIQSYLNNNSDTLVSKLEDLKTNVETKELDKDKLKQKTDDIYGEWKKIKESFATIALHDEIDLIETAIIRIKAKIEIGKSDESIEDIETSIFLLKHIKEKEKTSLKNIF